jgi:hypothetical protein
MLCILHLSGRRGSCTNYFHTPRLPVEDRRYLEGLQAKDIRAIQKESKKGGRARSQGYKSNTERKQKRWKGYVQAKGIRTIQKYMSGLC